MAKKQKKQPTTRKINEAISGMRCWFCEHEVKPDYKDPKMLEYFLTPRGRILPKHITGVCASCQRKLSVHIKRARQLALIR